jgi:hypothetical protein
VGVIIDISINAFSLTTDSRWSLANRKSNAKLQKYIGINKFLAKKLIVGV